MVRDGIANSLRIYFTKYVATVEQSCSRGWTRPEGLNFENLPLPHMGCSTASALAQMMANPQDLVSPHEMGGYDGERAAISIAKYRTGAAAKTASAGTSGGEGGDK
jgi:pilus biogenesis lipoprotein CpaD